MFSCEGLVRANKRVADSLDIGEIQAARSRMSEKGLTIEMVEAMFKGMGNGK